MNSRPKALQEMIDAENIEQERRRLKQLEHNLVELDRTLHIWVKKASELEGRGESFTDYQEEQLLKHYEAWRDAKSEVDQLRKIVNPGVVYG